MCPKRKPSKWARGCKPEPTAPTNEPAALTSTRQLLRRFGWRNSESGVLTPTALSRANQKAGTAEERVLIAAALAYFQVARRSHLTEVRKQKQVETIALQIEYAKPEPVREIALRNEYVPWTPENAKRAAGFVGSVPTDPVSDTQDGQAFRLLQAEQLARAAGYVPNCDGTFSLPTNTTSRPGGSA